MSSEKFRVPPSACLSCGKTLDAAALPSGDDTTARPGAITVCMYCGHPMAYANDMTLRELTDKEMHDIAGDKDFIHLQNARAEVMRRREQIANEKKPTEPVTTLWAVLAVQPNGAEGIVATDDDSAILPLICSQADHIQHITRLAKESLVVKGIPMRLVKFTRGETVEEFTP